MYNYIGIGNVPGLSERTLRRDIAKSDFAAGPEIQVNCMCRLQVAIYI